MKILEEMADIRDTIRNFLIDNFLMGDIVSMIGDGESLVDTGTIDSTGVLEIVDFLEKHFAIKVNDADMIKENMDSVKALVAFVQNRSKHVA